MHPMHEAYYSDDHVTLYHGDCREITEWLVADVLVTDPPYGRMWKQGHLAHLGRPTDIDNRRPGIRGDGGTGVRDSAIALWGNKRAIVFGDLNLAPPGSVRQTLIYRKPPDAGVRGATAGRRRDVEAVYLVGPWASGLGGSSSIITTGARIQGSEHGAAGRYGHPHAKPVDVMAELINLSDNGSVADPFAGSGSTLVAAKLCGRQAIGVEIEERYCEIAARRLLPDTLPFGAAS